MDAKVKKLKEDLKKLRDKWDERSNFSLKGVRNLSPADLDTIELYADTWRRNGGTFRGLMRPLGNVEKVLMLYGITEPDGYR